MPLSKQKMRETVTCYPRMHGKIWETYKRLLELSFDGKGKDTLMICYPDAPYHYKPKQSLWELDGIPQVTFYQEKIFDYPIKSVDEWIEFYNQNGYFVK